MKPVNARPSRFIADLPLWWKLTIGTVAMLMLIAVVTLAPWLIIVWQSPKQNLVAADVIGIVAVLSLIGVVITIFLTVYVARAFIQPIVELTRIVLQAQNDDLILAVGGHAGNEIAQLIGAFNALLDQANRSAKSLEHEVTERTDQLAAINEIATTVSSTLDVGEVLSRTVNIIRDRLGFYHVSVFLMDEKYEYAVVRESTGEIGRIMKERGHRLALGSQSIIGYVTQHHQARIALDVSADAVHFNNPLLPNTRSEMALPLIVGDTLIGALDVQSTEANAFDADDVAVLQNMANQIAIAMNNARLYQEAQARIKESNQLTQLYLTQSWQSYTRAHAETVNLRLEGETVKPAPELNETDLNLRAPTLSEDGTIMSVPITLRDQIIGEFSLSAPPESVQWSSDDLLLAEAVIAQVALAIENARLLEETQSSLAATNRLARRERMIADVSQKLTAGLEIKNVLQIAADELQRGTNSRRAVVRLTIPTAEGTE
ncbi:MAG: GAF domain-containing protein [Chloroflexi bacterium]|nr:GAF domain-containing protein [Chloroflexota bacterium]MBI5052876.1 GAF domain-containing protein [Chloroflexota bacterium]MBI5082548.1 GAF domain-containing protein [Chloroflexota bacterium]